MKKQLIGLAVTVALMAGTTPMAFAVTNTNNNGNSNTNGNNNGTSTTNNTQNNTSNTGSSSASASAYSNGSSSKTVTVDKKNNGNNSSNTSDNGNTTSTYNDPTTYNNHQNNSRSRSFSIGQMALSKSDLRATTSHNRVAYRNHSGSNQTNNFDSAFARVNGITNASQNSGNMSNVQQSVNVSISGGSHIR